MAWLKHNKDWLPSRVGMPHATPDHECPDILSELLPDDLQNKASFNTWEVAQVCGCHKKTVENWVHDGRLTVIRLPGGRIRVTRSAFLAFLQSYNVPKPPQWPQQKTKKGSPRSK